MRSGHPHLRNLDARVPIDMKTKPTVQTLLSLLPSTFLLALALSCSKQNNVNVDDSTPAGNADIGAACTQNGNCGSSLCLAGTCRKPCQSASECGTGAICLYETQAKASGCSLAGEATCTVQDGCKTKAFGCGIDGRCRTSCSGSCTQQGNYCVDGTCFGGDETEGTAASVVRCVSQSKPQVFCDGATLTTCNAPGKPGWVAGPTCSTADLCNIAAGKSDSKCAEAVCQKGDTRCNPTTFLFEQCNAGLSGFDALAGATACATLELCQQGLKAAPPACPKPACDTGQSRCREGVPETCNKGRTDFAVGDDCPTQSKKCNPLTATCLDLAVNAGEVTRQAYADFVALADNSAVFASIPGCEWKNNGSGHYLVTPDNWAAQQANPTLPVVGVDWCDAFAYCAWRSQHLCGKIGGGMVTFASFGDPGSGEWTNACTSGGEFAYPYGDTYQSQACNDAGKSKTGAIEGLFPATSSAISGCRSTRAAYAAIVNMLGNVGEWENACEKDATVASANPGKTDKCRVRGGDTNTPTADMAAGCSYQASSLLARDARSATMGFRCCGAP